MKFIVIWLAITITIATCCGHSKAQIRGLSAGEKVRIFLPPARSGYITGTVTSLDSTTIKIVNDQREWTIPIGSIMRLDVSDGRRSGTRTGAVIGGGLGVIAGAAIVAGNPWRKNCSTVDICILDSCVPQRICITRGIKPASGLMIGALCGAAIGAVLGGFSRVEHWRNIPFDAKLSLLPPAQGNRSVKPILTLKIPLSN